MAYNNLDIDALAKIYPGHRSQIEHRASIIKGWNIPPGSRVLEIGPGQGDCTIVLAAAVGEHGHVDAVDPAPLDYGSPTTLGEAQAHLSASPLGPRITWIQADPQIYLSTPPSDEKDLYTHVVLFHSLWYFDSPSKFPSLLRPLSAHLRPNASLCIAEYALQASSSNAVPHVLAALAHAGMELAEGKDVMRNVKTVVGPAWIKEVAGTEGWVIINQDQGRERVVVPPKGLADGRWEVGTVEGEEFEQEVEVVAGRDERLGAMLRGMREAVLGAVRGVEGGLKGVETMNVWAGAFVKAE